MSDFPTDLTNNTRTYDFLAPWMNDVGAFLNDLVIGDAGVPSYASDPTLTPGTPLVWINTTSDVLKFSPDGVATVTILTTTSSLTENVQDIIGAMVSAVGGTWTYDDTAGTLEFEVTQQVEDLDDVPDSATRLALTTDERTKLSSLHRRIDIYWEPGDETSKLDADEMITDAGPDTATTWTRAIQFADPPNNGIDAVGPPQLKVSCPTGLTGANTRILLPIVGTDTSANDRITSTLLSHTQGAQYGHFHRWGTDAGDPIFYIGWHDILFTVDSIWNLNTWKTDAATRTTLTQGSANGNGNVDFPGIQRWYDIRASAKYGTTVTLIIDQGDSQIGHGIVVGDAIVVDTGLIQDSATVTAVDGTNITYTSGTSAAVPIPVGGRGRMYSRRAIWPLKLCTELVGTTLRLEVWRLGKGQPDWSYEQNAARFINTGVGSTGPGKSGLYFGHLATDTANIVIGSVTWEALDA